MKALQNRSRTKKGFSLIEMLAVLGIMGILSSVCLVSISGNQDSQQISSTAFQIKEALDEARTYAMANKTYTWVGFYEENGVLPSATPALSGAGRIVISMVASSNGARYSDAQITAQYPAAFGSGDNSNSTPLIQINPLIKLNGARMGQLSGTGPTRPSVSTYYQVGDPAGSLPNNGGGLFAQRYVGSYATNPTTFNYPLTPSNTQPLQYTFTKIIEFNPRGEVSKIGDNTYSGLGPQTMEIALQLTHGTTTDGKFLNTPSAVVQLEGFSGKTRIY